MRAHNRRHSRAVHKPYTKLRLMPISFLALARPD